MCVVWCVVCIVMRMCCDVCDEMCIVCGAVNAVRCVCVAMCVMCCMGSVFRFLIFIL